VPRWFTKRIVSLSNLSYYERLFKLDNERLKLRCLRAGLQMCYKILIHFIDILQEDFLTISIVKITRGNSLKVILPNSKVDARVDFISVGIINV